MPDSVVSGCGQHSGSSICPQGARCLQGGARGPAELLLHGLLPSSLGQAFPPQLSAGSVPGTPAPAQLSPRFAPAGALIPADQAPAEAQQLAQNAAQLQAQAENLKVGALLSWQRPSYPMSGTERPPASAGVPHMPPHAGRTGAMSAPQAHRP